MRLDLRRLLLALLVVIGQGLATAEAQQAPEPPAGEYQALLLTYGPGDVYWERFGHNAIWLREPARGLDHSFNFGFFDFEQPRFLQRFLQGRMLYFAAAMPVEREMNDYREAGRSIRVQALNLDPLQFAHLRDMLLDKVKPENRDYLYDYYLDNCSTRVRDALDVALDGALAEQFDAQPGLQTFRDHTRRATERDYWYYLGLETGLGMPVDHPVSRWDEMFMPVVLADSLPEVTRLGAGGLEPLVLSDTVEYEGRVAAAAATPTTVWPRYLALGLAIALAGWLASRFAAPVLADGLALGWALIAASLGSGLLALVLFTDHEATRPNFNLFLLNPMFLAAVVPMLRRPLAVIALAGVVGAALVAAWPGLQYNADVLAFLAPVNGFMAWRLWRPAFGRQSEAVSTNSSR